MEVSEQLVDELAALSKLHFSAEEKQAIRADLEKIVGFFEKLQEVDTTGVEPLTHMGLTRDVFREDLPAVTLGRAEALAPAAAHNDLYFFVPKVIKK